MDWSERIIPDKTTKGIVAIHLKRYEFARSQCQNRSALDVGCGMGYGSHYLAEEASRVMAVDMDSEAIRYARTRYAKKNLIYLLGDAQCLPFLDGSFDAVCSFEIIEHTQMPQLFLKEVARVLKRDGLFFVSTPSVRETSFSPQNPYHYQEWSSGDFKELLEKYFSDVKISWQTRKQTQAHRRLQKLDIFSLRGRWFPTSIARVLARMTRTVAFSDLGLDDLEIQPHYSENALCQIGVCRLPK